MMTDIMTLQNTLIVTTCLVVGNLLKYSFPNLPNRLIPLILGGVGVLLAILWTGSFNGQNILIGFISGLASTGIHQIKKGLLDRSVFYEDTNTHDIDDTDKKEKQ